MKQIILLGACMMALGVVLGAFGAHGLKEKIPANLLAAYQAGVEYHFYHALGLILVGIMAFHFPQASGLRIGSWILFLGIVLFSGSLYVMALTGIRWLGAITPIGGTAFIVGWLWIVWSVFQYRA